MTIGSKSFSIAFLITTIFFILYVASIMINDSKKIHIRLDANEGISIHTIMKIALIKSSSKYDGYTEKKIINIKNNIDNKIPLEQSFRYEVFVIYKDKTFYSTGKDQIYDHLRIDVENKFKLKEIDGKLYLFDYGLKKLNDTEEASYAKFPLMEFDTSKHSESEKYLYSPAHNNFMIESLPIDYLSFAAKLPRSELEQLTFIPSDKKKVEELRRQAGFID